MQTGWGWKWGIGALCVLGALIAGPASAQVRGFVDGTFPDGSGGFVVRGWACQTGYDQSINVHMYVGGPAGTGTYAGAASANQASSSGVAAACQSTGTAHRFALPLSAAVRQAHGGKPIYIHGLRIITAGSNLLLDRSGDYLIPRPVAAIRRYTYNAHQELCKVVEPETGTTVMAYDGAGNLAWSAGGLNLVSHNSCDEASAPANRKVVRSYDARNRLSTLTFADGKGNQTWTYMADGLPAKIVTEQPQVIPVENTYTYNRRRLLATESTKIASTVYLHQSNYNANGHLSGMVYGSGLSVALAPNALGQPTQAGGYATGASYHPNGALKQFTYGNGIVHTLTQNVRGLPAVAQDAYGSHAFLKDEYGYDQNGNVLAITDAATGRNQRGNRSMSYDALNRLTQVASGTASAPMFGAATYGYDALDNLTRVAVTGGNEPRDHHYCYDGSWRLTNVKTSNCSGSTVIGLGYDAQGNVLNKNGQGYEFDLGNRLRRSTGKEWYAYDGHGRRVLSCTSTACDYQQYAFDGKLYYHRDNREAKHFNNIYLGGRLVARWELPTAGGTVTLRYQHTDALGSPVVVTDASRAEVERTEYEPYGKPANRAARSGMGYTGHVEDGATGLTYMQQRYMDPQLGVFLSVDPVTAYDNPVGQFHRYRYASNNPYTRIDPDGRRDIYIGGAADKDNTRIVQNFAGGQNNLNQGRDIQYFSYKEKSEIKAAINAPLKDGEPLNVTGHSLGAREAIRQANSTEAKITNLVTIDPVGSAGNGEKPANTENWINVTANPATRDSSDTVASLGRVVFGTTNTSGAATSQTSTANHGSFGTMMNEVKAVETIDASYQKRDP